MKEQILEIKTVKYPGFEKDIVSFNFVKDIKIQDDGVFIDIEIVSANPEVANEIRKMLLKLYRVWL